MSTITPVPPQNPGQSPIFLPPVVNPALGIWWQPQTVTGIPESTIGWMLAQGFEITAVTPDDSTNPPTKKFTVQRTGMRPDQVLLSLTANYTKVANEAREANQVRYNQIVANWTQMIQSTQLHFTSQVNLQNIQAGVYFANLDIYMSQLDALIAENRNQIIVDAQAANTALGDMNTKLSDLETNTANNASVITTILGQQAGFLGTFLSEFIAKLNELDSDYSSHLSSILANINNLGGVLDAHIPAYQAQFATLESNYNSHLGTLEGLLATALANTTNFTSQVENLLGSLDSDYLTIETNLNGLLSQALALADAHAIDYNTVLGLLLADYNEHAPIATAFLNNLGATELARINEQFASSLAGQLQDLISRGLHSSAVAVDITARNHRHRDEQIQSLNDRLNREKFENQHRLYEQKVAMRTRTLDGKDRIHSVRQEILRYHASQITGIYSLLQDTRNRALQGRQAILSAQDANNRLAIDVQSGLYAKTQEVRLRVTESIDRVYQLRDILAKWKTGEQTQLYQQLIQIQSQHLSGIDRRHALQQEISRIAMGQRDTLLAQLQDAVKGILGGKERYSQILMQNASTLAGHKHKAIAELMNTAVMRLEGWTKTQDQNRQLMAYQLDERNKLLVGLYSFVERRDDIAPEWESMAKMVASLGDAGGGWLQP